jgi:type IV secretion system protein TrbL
VITYALSSSTALAAGAQLDQITDAYKNGASGWEAVLRGYAINLFAALVAIEVAFSSMKLAFKGADFSEWVGELVNRIMFVGFFSALLTNSSTWAKAIIDSFRLAGDAAAQAGGGSGGIRPSDVFNAGMQLATTVVQGSGAPISIESMSNGLVSVISAVGIIVCFALIAALMVLALCESYIVVSAGVLLMGFGGSRWTKDFAVKTITYAVSVGAKLFVMQLIVGIGESMVKGWASSYATTGTMTDVFTMLGSSIVMLALTKTIPDIVQGLISGVSPSGAGIVSAATGAVAGAVAGGAAGLAGGAMGVGAAKALASEQMAADPNSATGLAGVASGLFKGAKNLGAAAASDVGGRLSGQPSRGTMGGRMANAMSNEAASLRASTASPSQPAFATAGPGPSSGNGQSQFSGPSSFGAGSGGNGSSSPPSPGGNGPSGPPPSTPSSPSSPSPSSPSGGGSTFSTGPSSPSPTSFSSGQTGPMSNLGVPDGLNPNGIRGGQGSDNTASSPLSSLDPTVAAVPPSYEPDGSGYRSDIAGATAAATDGLGQPLDAAGQTGRSGSGSPSTGGLGDFGNSASDPSSGGTVASASPSSQPSNQAGQPVSGRPEKFTTVNSSGVSPSNLARPPSEISGGPVQSDTSSSAPALGGTVSSAPRSGQALDAAGQTGSNNPAAAPTGASGQFGNSPSAPSPGASVASAPRSSQPSDQGGQSASGRPAKFTIENDLGTPSSSLSSPSSEALGGPFQSESSSMAPSTGATVASAPPSGISDLPEEASHDDIVKHFADLQKPTEDL